MSAKHFDVVVIGSGPGGEGAAMKLVKSGKRVAVIEAHDKVGGGCTHWGTIPSKALRHNIQLLRDYRKNPLFQHTQDQIQVEYSDLLQATGEVISEQVRSRLRHYARNRIEVIHGRASFIDTHRLEIMQDRGVSEEVTGDHFVIATGSRPYHPQDLDFSHPRVLDSDSVLRMDSTPDSITIYGAGVIGCEYASIFCNLDVKVNLVNTRDRLLSFLDDEITDALSYHLRNQGTVIRHDEEYEQVEPMDDGVVLHCKSGKKFKTDVLLWANGRSGNTEKMGLEEIGVSVNHRGQIEIDKTYATSAERQGRLKAEAVSPR
ncbi:MAG: FAD-dependent oxidoreductase [Candidatus Thiodiazotropha sp. L084R]